MIKTDLSSYKHTAEHCKARWLKRILWYYVNAIVFKSSLFPFSGLKVRLLRLFGASIGKSVVIKPSVNIKHPWLLQIGDHSWIGEKVWIDNLVMVWIGEHVCLSQGCMLLTGSHNYKDPAFRLITGSIVLCNGVWICARAIVTSDIIADSHAILCTGSVATTNLAAWSVYQGNPASKVKNRL